MASLNHKTQIKAKWFHLIFMMILQRNVKTFIRENVLLILSLSGSKKQQQAWKSNSVSD